MWGVRLYAKRQPEDRLFLAFACTLSVEAAERKLRDDSEVCRSYDLAQSFRTLSEFRSLEPASFSRRFRDLSPQLAPALRSFYLYWYTYLNQYRLQAGDLEDIETSLSDYYSEAPADYGLLRLLRAAKLYLGGNLGRVGELLEQNLPALEDLAGHPYPDFVRALMYSQLGKLHQRQGDYNLAFAYLQRACRISGADGGNFVTRLVDQKRLGDLLWSSGQHEAALELHQDTSSRALARELGLGDWLTRSHYTAAKCAIDLERTDLAEYELSQARKILTDPDIEVSPSACHQHEGYLLLFQGEAALQRAEFERALELVEKALERFESGPAAFYPGVIDAKIAIAQFALYYGDHRLFYNGLGRLFQEVEEHGLVDARSRLLMLESYLFITDDPPLAAAYDNLLQRVHLINNPTVLLRTLGCLYQYSLKHLDKPAQADLRTRIENLEGLLSDSCYQDLYQRYVTDLHE